MTLREAMNDTMILAMVRSIGGLFGALPPIVQDKVRRDLGKLSDHEEALETVLRDVIKESDRATDAYKRAHALLGDE